MSEDRSQELLSAIALGVFRLNGEVLAVAEQLARPVGLTAAWWQVLGAVLPQPLPVSEIARVMGITRQSVQRIADLLVERGLAEYGPNPAHRRAKLLRPTAAGREAIERIGPAHAAAAARLVERHGVDGLRHAVEVLAELTASFEALAASGTGMPGEPIPQSATGGEGSAPTGAASAVALPSRGRRAARAQARATRA